MKIALLSFQDTINFGAILQLYANYLFLVENGHECTIINYINSEIHRRELPFEFFPGFKPRKLLAYCLFHNPHEEKYNSFQKFLQNNTNMTSKLSVDDLDKLNDYFDYFMSGSDMIWCFDITGKDETYFLNFVKEKYKKISYASSFGHKICFGDRERISALLNDYSNILVRENEGASIVKDLVGKDANVVCDPTMLIKKKNWEELANKSNLKLKKKYVLIYFFDRKSQIVEDARRFANENGFEVIAIHCGLPVAGVDCIWPTNVEDFLYLIYNAEIVLTGSYHGMLFSLYFNRPFYYYNLKDTMRINTLVDRFDLNDFDGQNITDFRKLPKLDYELINKQIEEYREYSAKMVLGGIK